MTKGELLNKLVEVEKYLAKSDEFKDTIKLARTLYERGQFDLCERVMEKLPSREQLFKELVSKLEGKSVYRSLEKIIEGRVENNWTVVKGLSSLLTHTVIECERGNTEFGMLIPNIIERLNEVTFDVLQ